VWIRGTGKKGNKSTKKQQQHKLTVVIFREATYMIIQLNGAIANYFPHAVLYGISFVVYMNYAAPCTSINRGNLVRKGSRVRGPGACSQNATQLLYLAADVGSSER
jgi:hypothetical protein